VAWLLVHHPLVTALGRAKPSGYITAVYVKPETPDRLGLLNVSITIHVPIFNHRNYETMFPWLILSPNLGGKYGHRNGCTLVAGDRW